MKNKLILLIFLFGTVQASMFAQKKKIIDFEDHLSAKQAGEIENLIQESGVNISVVFFNVNEIMGFPLENPRSVDDYIDLWKQNNKDAVLVVFSNMKAEPKYWENNLKLISTSSMLIKENIDNILTNAIPLLQNTKYNITNEKGQQQGQQQDIFYNTIIQLIGQIANDANKIIQILNVGEEKENGFGAGIVAESGAGSKKDASEKMDYDYSIDNTKVSNAKFSIYTKQGKLVFEQEIPVGQNQKQSWDGHKTPIEGEKGKKYITFEESPFKIVITAFKDKSSKLAYTATSEYKVHERTLEWIEAYKMDDNHQITRNVELSADMEKNRFRRFLALEDAFYREYLIYGFDLEKNKITPLKYLMNNLVMDANFMGHTMPMHKGFVGLINSISFKGKYTSMWSLSVRYIRGKEKEKDGQKPKISEHALGCAFDVDPAKNGMIESKIYFEYMKKLTWLNKWKEIPPPQALYDASNIFKAICEQRREEKKIDVDQLLSLLSETAYKISNESLKISDFIDACMVENGTSQLYNEYNDLYVKSIPLNSKRRLSQKLDQTELDKEVQISKELDILINKIENYLNIIDLYSILFFLDKRKIAYPTMNVIFYDFKNDITPTIKYLNEMHGSIQNLKAILNLQMNNLALKAIPEIEELDKIKQLNFLRSNEFDERLAIFRDLQNFDFNELGKMLKNQIGQNQSYIRLSFIYGFCNILPEDAESWISRKELRWGVYQTRLDCMHLELNPKYATEFYSIYNK